MMEESRRHHALNSLLTATRRVCRLAAWFGGSLFVLVSFLITIEIVLRKFFNSSLGGADELTGYALAAAASWSFGFAVLERAHIRVDSLYLLMPSRLRALLDVVALAAMLMFFGFILYFALIMFADTIHIGARSRTSLYTPLVIPQTIWLLGLVMSVGVTTVLLTCTIAALLAGNVRRVAELAGSKSAQEELEEELASLEAQHRREVRADPAAAGVPHP